MLILKRNKTEWYAYQSSLMIANPNKAPLGGST
jgi:hypothetical protein